MERPKPPPQRRGPLVTWAREQVLNREFARGWERGYDAGLREARNEQRLKENPDWYAVRAVIPVELRVAWEETRYLLRQEGIVHPNRAVETGMHLEVLVAEYLGSARAHRDGKEGVDG